jgi:uncharacterized protein (UPF0548 family)
VKAVLRPTETTLSRFISRYAPNGFSYPEVGGTQDEHLPQGYHQLSRSTVLGSTDSTFELAADRLRSWAMHRRAGLVLAASADRADADVTVVMALSAGLAGLLLPCRVVWTVDEPDRCGFAYGTCPAIPNAARRHSSSSALMAW